jgi:hypothetical protein
MPSGRSGRNGQKQRTNSKHLGRRIEENAPVSPLARTWMVLMTGLETFLASLAGHVAATAARHKSI